VFSSGSSSARNYIFFKGNNYSLYRNIEKGKQYLKKNSKKIEESDFVDNPSSGGGGGGTTYIDNTYRLVTVVPGTPTIFTIVTNEGDVTSSLTDKTIQIGNSGDFPRSDSYTVNNPTFGGSSTSFEVSENIGAYTVSETSYVGVEIIEGITYGTSYNCGFITPQIILSSEDISTIFEANDLVKLDGSNGITVHDEINAVTLNKGINKGKTTITLKLGLKEAQAGDTIAIQKIVAKTPPVADFTTNNTKVSTGSTVVFKDSSINNPTSWAWTFEGGTPATSIDQNPTVVYGDITGTYDISLTASNAYGSNTKTNTDYIEILNLGPNLVINGGFEAADPTVAWPDGQGVLTNSTVRTFEGTQSGLLKKKNFYADGSRRAQDITIESGVTYYLSGWAYKNSSIDSVFLRVLDSKSSLLDIIGYTGSGEWSYGSTELSAATTSVTVRIETSSQFSGTYFDQIELRKVL